VIHIKNIINAKYNKKFQAFFHLYFKIPILRITDVGKLDQMGLQGRVSEDR
jgi:hypothetical protein